jgi:3-dehydroquinate synthase
MQCRRIQVPSRPLRAAEAGHVAGLYTEGMNGATASVRIDLGERSYDILIGSGLLNDKASFDGLPAAGSAVVVTNTTVAPLYAERLMSCLRERCKRVHLVTLPDGERHKDWPTMNSIFDAMLQAQCDRRTLVFALGGGVVGDITGFAAACYMRGVPYVQVPTTLLAQVDSSVGGKTAINHELGKNMIGTFNQPLRVIADLETLATLPRRELVAGLAEVIKYGPIADAPFLDWIDTNLDALLARDEAALRYAIRRSCEIKAQVVQEDERESDRRAVLNFGHTFAHAIETGLGHGEWLHGEAVGCGMVMAADLSARLGRIDTDDAKRVHDLIRRAGLPTMGPRLDLDRYLALMRVDKKAIDGEIRFVLLDGIGNADVAEVPENLVREVLAAHTVLA